MAVLTQSPAWQALQSHHEKLRHVHMRELFADDPQRYARFSCTFNDVLLDYSKNIATAETMALLMDLARQADIRGWTEKMFRGDPINVTEDRAVLHVALRNRDNHPIYAGGADVMPKVNAVLAQMREFSERARSGAWRGYSDKPLTDVVNIGIGGSDLGPVMVTEALKPYGRDGLRPHFVSNVDGTHIAEPLRTLAPAPTQFIIASKPFPTQGPLTQSQNLIMLSVSMPNSSTASAFVESATK